MRKEDISDALNFLDDDLLEQTNALRIKPQKKPKSKPTIISIVSSSKWTKWGSMAAALVVVGAVGINLLTGGFGGASKKFSVEKTMAPANGMAFDAAIADTKSIVSMGETETEEIYNEICTTESFVVSPDCYGDEYAPSDNDWLMGSPAPTLPDDRNLKPGFETAGCASDNEVAPVYMEICFETETGKTGEIRLFGAEGADLKVYSTDRIELMVEVAGEWKKVPAKMHYTANSDGSDAMEEVLLIGEGAPREKESIYGQKFSMEDFYLDEYDGAVQKYMVIKKVRIVEGSEEFEREISCEFLR